MLPLARSAIAKAASLADSMSRACRASLNFQTCPSSIEIFDAGWLCARALTGTVESSGTRSSATSAVSSFTVLAVRCGSWMFLPTSTLPLPASTTMYAAGSWVPGAAAAGRTATVEANATSTTASRRSRRPMRLRNAMSAPG